MPELPETETIARDLDREVAGARIVSVAVARPDVLREVTARALARRVSGASIERSWRRAKLIVIDLTTGDRLVVQPRFTGALLIDRGNLPERERRYSTIEFALEDGRALHYRDIRRLGTVALMSPERFASYTGALGIEPLDPHFTGDHLSGLLRASRQAIKKVLMDQRVLAGVGNIYANEALWRAGIDPSRRSDRVTVLEAVTPPRRHRRRARGIDRTSRNELPRLSRRQRLTWKFRRTSRGVWSRRRVVSALRPSADRDERHRRTNHGAMRALSKVALIRPPTSDEQLAVMRAHVRDTATDRPGVYRMIAADGEIVYVGKSKQMRSRLLSYFRCAFPEEKGARILRDAERIEWEYMPSEFAALLEELRLIKRYRPRFNVAMKRDGRNYCFIKITRGPAPKLVVVRGPGGDDSSIYYGPFMGASGVTDAVRELNDVFGLRDCAADQRMYFADQPELFDIFPRTPGCIRFEVKKCLGPCVGGCSVQQYADRMALARAFLDGTDDGPIAHLRGEMEAASERLEYERAATLRDKLKRVEALRSQFARLRFAVETLSFVYTVPGYEADDRVYLIRRGRVRAETALPREPAQAGTLMRLIDEVFTPVERDTGQIPTHEIDELLLLSSWFRRFPDELERTSAARGVAPLAVAS